MTAASSGVLVEVGQDLFDPSGYVTARESLEKVDLKGADDVAGEADACGTVEPVVEGREWPADVPDGLEGLVTKFPF